MRVVRLRRAMIDDLWESFADDTPDLWAYMPYGPFADPSAMLAQLVGWEDSADPLFVGFETGGRIRGWGSYLRITPEHGVIEIGNLAYSRHLRRTTAATEAVYLMLDHAFRLGYRRCEWKCDSLNEVSRRAALRLGFRPEGVFLDHMVYKGRNRDTAWYAITAGEWPARRERLEGWLHPSNFAADGHQVRPLSEFGTQGI